MVDRITDPWGPRTPYGRAQRWPERLDQALEDGRIVGVRGRTVNRVNRGRLDPKDLYGWRANNPFAQRYSEEAPREPDRLHSELFRGTRTGGIGLLRDLQDPYLMTAECDICWTVAGQAARDVRDDDLVAVVLDGEQQTAVQLRWLRTRMKQAAPQALVVAD